MTDEAGHCTLLVCIDGSASARVVCRLSQWGHLKIVLRDSPRSSSHAITRGSAGGSHEVYYYYIAHTATSYFRRSGGGGGTRGGGGGTGGGVVAGGGAPGHSPTINIS